MENGVVGNIFDEVGVGNGIVSIGKSYMGGIGIVFFDDVI